MTSIRRFTPKFDQHQPGLVTGYADALKPTWQTEDGSVRLFLGDCLDVLPGLSGVDAVVTDPPYGVGGGTGAISVQRAKADYEGFDDSPEYVRAVCVPAVELCRQIAKRCVVTPGLRCMFEYPKPYETGCFYYPAGAGMSRWGFNCYQPIFFYGPSPNAGTLGHHNSRRSTEGSDSRIDHPCPKPIRDWLWLLCISSKEGETVLDPFMGSGTTGVACVRTGRCFIGIEKEEKYFDIAVKRITAELSRAPLFEPKPQVQRELL